MKNKITLSCERDGEVKWFDVKVGDGCTICYYTDRKAGTIIGISDDEKTITVQEDKATRTDTRGESDWQEYEFERDLNGTIHTFKRTRKYKSLYTDNGISKWGDYGTSLLFGVRREYFDYSF